MFYYWTFYSLYRRKGRTQAWAEGNDGIVKFHLYLGGLARPEGELNSKRGTSVKYYVGKELLVEGGCSALGPTGFGNGKEN